MMNTRKRLIGLCAAGLTLSACATKLDTIVLEDLDGFRQASGPLVTVSEPAPDLMQSQSSKAGFGLFGAAANADTGRKLVNKGVISDPSLTVEAKLNDYIADKTRLEKTTPLIFEDRKSVPDAPSVDGGYTIDANTTLWGLNYYPLNWTSYQTYYSSNVRLLDSEGEVVAATNCEFKYPENKEDTPNYNALVKDDGVLMQENLQIMADKCVEKFKTEALNGF